MPFRLDPPLCRHGIAGLEGVETGAHRLMLAATRVFGADCSDADQLTQAALEGRRQLDNLVERLRLNFMGGKSSRERNRFP